MEGTLNKNIVLSTKLDQGEIRIVLEWGENPRDLDSHLTGNLDSGSSFHIYYMNPRVFAGGRETANLDLDETSGFGPETTTLYIGLEGEFKFQVHDYTHAGSGSSTALASSGATVKVYMPGQQGPVIYTVPEGQGTMWTVFTIDHMKLQEVGEIN